MNQNTLLITFVKNLKKGQVKTRLAKSVGDENALNIYKKLLSHTRNVIKPLDVSKQVWYAWHIPKDDAWNSQEYEKRLQKGNDLGDRMHYAFDQAFRENYERVVIIGSDCAELTTEILKQAFEQLGNADLVIGPSGDGGYYLLGMNSFHSEIFKNISWSTPSVLQETKRRAEKLNLMVSLLPALNDVDSVEDWNEVKDRF